MTTVRPGAKRTSRRLFEGSDAEYEYEYETVRIEVPEEAETTLRHEVDDDVAAEMPPPQGLERYQHHSEVGAGGMARVCRVFDRLIMREVAMKLRMPSRSALEVTRFVEEAQITGQLDHPNIVPIHDLAFEDDGLPSHFTMKLVRGKTLRQLVDDLPIEMLHAGALREFLRAFLKVTDAISFAHSRGVVHRDLKPANVMVGSHGQVYVMDWGIAILLEGDRPSTVHEQQSVRIGREGSNVEAVGSLSGTPAFMAPEQAQGRSDEIDPRTDVFGLGGILYYFLTKSAPYAGNDKSDELILAMSGVVTQPQLRTPSHMLPAALCRIAMKALATAPEDRYQSVDAMAEEVEAFLYGGGWLQAERVAAGTVIVRQDTRARAAYIIVEGRCRVTRMINGTPHLVATMGPGEAFGETALLESSLRRATVTALTDVVLQVADQATLAKELDDREWLRTLVEGTIGRLVEQDRENARLRARLAEREAP